MNYQSMSARLASIIAGSVGSIYVHIQPSIMTVIKVDANSKPVTTFIWFGSIGNAKKEKVVTINVIYTQDAIWSLWNGLLNPFFRILKLYIANGFFFWLIRITRKYFALIN